MNNQYSSASIRYLGSAVQDGIIDAEKLGNAVLGLNNALKKIASTKQEWKNLKPTLRVAIRKGSIDVALYIVAASIAIEKVGVAEFSKAFFGELGKQLALKIFAKKKVITKEGRPTIKNGVMFVTVVNQEGEKKEIELASLDLYSKRYIDNELSSIIMPLEKNNIDKIEYSFGNANKYEVNEADKEYFSQPDEVLSEVDLTDDFDDAKSEVIHGLRGRLVSYQALATKYPFQFQPREQQKLYGKKFIACMLIDENYRDKYIDLMKSYVGDVIIKGYGVKDSRGRYSKIKIISIQKDEQRELFEYGIEKKHDTIS